MLQLFGTVVNDYGQARELMLQLDISSLIRFSADYSWNLAIFWHHF